MAMILNSQYPDAKLTADVLLGEEDLGDGEIQSDLKKLNTLLAARKGNSRGITPGDLIGDSRGADLESLKAADRKLSKLLARRTVKR